MTRLLASLLLLAGLFLPGQGWATERTDTLNRADTTSAIGTPSDGGASWSVQAGTWGISSNTGYESGGTAQSTAVLESSISDVQVQVTISGADLSNAGIVFRAADDNNYMMVVLLGTDVILYKRVAGSFTNITSATATASAGDVWKVTVDSSNNITVYQNGASRLTHTDGTHSTNTKHGLRTHNNSAPRFDDFTICPFAGCSAGGPDVTPFYKRRVQ